MENNTPSLNKVVNKDHKVILDNRKKMTLTGISKAVSANENMVVLLLPGQKMTVSGKGLHLNKLDMEQSIVEIEGDIFSFKYVSAATPQGFFKRIFS